MTRGKLLATAQNANVTDCNVAVAIQRPISVSSDQYRVLFAKVDLHCRTEGKKVVAVTSAVKGEGKTTTVSNMAVVAARDFGKRCLLVDGDFKNPSIHKFFNVTEETGLVDVVTRRCPLENAMKRGPVENLTLLTMGYRPEKENRIWTSETIREVLKALRGWFDYVLIDAPPVLPLVDMNLIGELADGVLVVVRSGVTEEALLAQAVKSLGAPKIIGNVLNGVKHEWPSRYYHQYGYY